MHSVLFLPVQSKGNRPVIAGVKLFYQHRCTRTKKRLLMIRRTTMTQQNQPNPPQDKKPGQPNPMPNKPGQPSQQTSGGQHDQGTNKK